MKDAGIDCSRVSYVECHGTGTELGDPVEIRGLRTVATDLLGGDFEHTCKLGSIKSNIGHLEYAAGVVGLIKVILQMKNKKIAKSLHCDELNPYIDLKGTPFQIAQQASDWLVEEGQTRIAGVSSFGFCGVNAHIILEEYQDLDANDNQLTDYGDENDTHILTLSAKNADSLYEYVEKFPEYIGSLDNDPLTLKRIAYTMQVGRQEMQERLVFIVNSVDEWAEQVDGFLAEKGKNTGRRVYRGSVKSNADDNIELGDTEAGRSYLQELIKANEAEKLAELWVKGSKIDWKVLHAA